MVNIFDTDSNSLLDGISGIKLVDKNRIVLNKKETIKLKTFV